MSFEWHEVLQEYDRNYHTLESAKKFYDEFAKKLSEDMKKTLDEDDSVKILDADGLSAEHEVTCEDRLPYLKYTIKIKEVDWFAVIARLATPWAKGKDVCSGKLHIGVKHLLDKKEGWESFSKIPSFSLETEEISVRQFLDSKVIEEKRCDYEDLDSWVYLEEFELTNPLNRNDLMTRYKNVVKNAPRYIDLIDSPIKKAYEALSSVRSTLENKRIVESQSFDPEDDLMKTDDTWDYCFFQVNTNKPGAAESHCPAIWIYFDTDKRRVCFGLSNKEENGVKFGPLNERFLKELGKVNSDFKESYDIDGYKCGTIVNKDSLEKKSVDQIAKIIEKALRTYGELVDKNS